MEIRRHKKAIYIAAGIAVSLVAFALFLVVVLSVVSKRKNPECGFIPKQQSQLVINGSIVKPEQFPHYVSITYSFTINPHCGGSIISPIWYAMQACGADLDYNCFEVVAGSLYTVDTTATVHRVVATKSFNKGVWEDDRPFFYLTDVALLEVSPAFKFRAHTENSRGVTSVCLPEVNEKINETKADIVGVGFVSEFHQISSDRIMTAQMDIIDFDACHQSTLRNAVKKAEDKDKVVCSGVSAESKSGCKKDSGGPLTINRNGKVIQIGVVSASPSSGCGDMETIFTSVAYYRQWIKDTTGV
ncbi:hypothetical protein B4U80_10635 [Leptotrombidium deliense]|uniref:Peptidase S1 domain-containing protein n=1 Tax=Leptotrombidium deliense TaxID=299467 RepID=A0A443SAF6_9ACAR|nr:hypothetical protein B4U80_10635 [Leptotrombidium deliense]